ncbi:MAG TPA: (deoxy)nucleoside triphosphate pyrophosphohydrolase [Kofleriaceae bacterium]|nr:(deoxy)nucleoside triphosphate pyrophosphohydrolase [Kofleriaceae bacterium]
MSEPVAARKIVVAALVCDADGRVLITRRRPDQPLPDQWEFPGGKIEPGESPQRALARELDEEIGARVAVGAIWDVLHHQYPTYEVLMLVFPCRLLAGDEPRALQVADLAWVRPTELHRFDILPADRPLIERLVREGTPPLPAI